MARIKREYRRGGCPLIDDGLTQTGDDFGDVPHSFSTCRVGIADRR